MRNDRWLEGVVRAARELEGRRVSVQAELQHELSRASHGDIVGLARGFARFEILAAQQCREAAATLDRVRETPRAGLALGDLALLEPLMELGHALETDCRLGLASLRDRLARTANAAVEWSGGPLEKALAGFAGSRAVPAARPSRDPGITWPMAGPPSSNREA